MTRISDCAHRFFTGTVATALVFAGSLSVLPCSPALAQSWGQFKQLGAEALDKQNGPEAARYWGRAYELVEGESPKGSRYYQSIVGLARSLTLEGKKSEAEPLFKQVLAAREAGDTSEEIDAGLREYESFLRADNRCETADAVASKISSTFAPAVAGQAQPVDVYSEWRQLIQSGQREFVAKNFSKAEADWTHALRLAKQKSGTNEMVFESLNSLTRLYLSCRRYADAELCLKRSVDIIGKTRGHASIEYLDGLMSHAQVLRRLNRKKEAMAQESRAEEVASSLGYITTASASGTGSGGGTARGGFYNSASESFGFGGISSGGGGRGRGVYSEGYSQGRDFGALMNQFRNMDF